MQSNCGAYELLFWELVQVSTGAATWKQQTSASKMRDVEWDTLTCVLGWAVQGVRSSADGTDVNAVDRSHNFAEEKVKDRLAVIAAADDLGRVRTYSYPSFLTGAAEKSYQVCQRRSLYSAQLCMGRVIQAT
jgi:hypothetical protein